jgi:SAM-dependent methyltransferase
MQETLEFYDRRADLYDLAFSWDVEEEVEWLVERLFERAGAERRRLLEPACGSGRMLVGFARRGVEVAGVDLSPRLLELARERLCASGVREPDLHCADIADFELGRRFDAALCPISSFGYLPDFDAAASHLACMARHLEPDAIYLVQLDLRCVEPFQLKTADEHSSWERETSRGSLRTSWFGREFDAERRIERQASRFEFVSGPEAGAVYEDEHEMRVWTWGEWSELVERSHFRLRAAYDGGAPDRPRIELGPALEDRQLTWLELVRT